MIRAGGDPDALALGGFLDLAHSVLVDGLRSHGVSLLEALDQQKDTAAGAHLREEREEEVDNDSSMAQLEQMLRGVDV